MLHSNLTDEEKITLASYNKHAVQWSNDHLSPGYWGDEINTFHKYLPEGRLLEVGCGGGRDARELIRLGYDYTGTDISAKLLAEAQKNNPSGRFEQVSLYDLNYSDKFDSFWCAAVLLHIPKNRIGEALKAIKRNLAPGAVGFIAIKEGTGETMEQNPTEEGSSRLFAYWENNEFKSVLEKNGFKVLSQNYKPLSERTRWLIYYVQAE
jgi:2-polyprenyl-3-methyl-5-hydroxy-6-metoxy-1,4-benzoquinol methylase